MRRARVDPRHFSPFLLARLAVRIEEVAEEEPVRATATCQHGQLTVGYNMSHTKLRSGDRAGWRYAEGNQRYFGSLAKVDERRGESVFPCPIFEHGQLRAGR